MNAKPKLFYAISGLIASFTLAGCGGPIVGAITGGNRVSTSTRDEPLFTAVSVHDSIKTTIHVGGAQSVKIKARRDSIDNVKTSLDGSTLTIRLGSGFVLVGGDVSADITVPTLTAVTASDSASLGVFDESSTDLTVTVNDASRIALSGHTAQAEYALHSNGVVDASAFPADTATVIGDGNASADLNIVTTLGGSLAGNSQVIVHAGNPAPNLNVSVKDNASLQRK